MRSLLVFAFSLLLIAGCAAPDRTAERPLERDRAVLISANELASDTADVVVLHVARERAHYDEGHIPGARYLPLTTFAVARDNQLNMLPETEALEADLEAIGIGDDSRVVVYGDFDGLAAARAFFAMDVHGVDVAVLDGGLAAWQAAGHAVSRDELPPAEPGALTLHLDAGRIVRADDVFERMDRDDVLLVDARPVAQYTAEETVEGVTRPGHIPGAFSSFWKDDLREDGTLRPIDELHAHYEAAGATADGEVISYCRTGVQASHTYLVLRAMGLEPLLYDGSFQDWSNNTDYPVATGVSAAADE